MSSDDSRYWSVDIVGLTKEGAEGVVEFAGSTQEVVGASIVDPDVWLTMHIDRSTVEELVIALSDNRRTSPTACAGILEWMREWLENAPD